MAKRTLNRQDATALQGWHPDGTPFTPADYRRAGLPVSAPKQLAHWAETERWIADIMAQKHPD